MTHQARLQTLLGPDSASRLAPRLQKALHRDGALVAPAALAADLARALGAPEAHAHTLELAAACFYMAADLADDLADGAIDQAHGDVERLLLVLPLVLAPLPDGLRLGVLDTLARGGLAMAVGQEQDLTGSGLDTGADPIAIAEAKAGAELAALFAAAGLVAGVQTAPLAEAGRHYGALLQALSDLEDLGQPGPSADWNNLTPTGPMRALLEHPVWGETARHWASGPGQSPARTRTRRGLLASVGLHAWIDAALERWAVPCRQALEAAGQPSCALDALAFVEQRLGMWRVLLAPVPFPRRRDGRLQRALEDGLNQTWAWLQAADPLEETVEVHRWGLFGAPEVRGDVFGRLLVLDQLARIARDLPGAREAVRHRHDTDGWRYYPGHPQIPPDADDTGLALVVLTDATPAHRHRWTEQLLQAQRADGSFPVWLAEPPEGYQWDDRPCPGVQANALRGLNSQLDSRHPSVLRAARFLDAQLLESLASPHYGPVLRDAMAVEALWATGERGPGLRAATARLCSVVAEPSRAGVLDLCAALAALAVTQATIPWAPAVRSLLDRLTDEGSAPPEPVFRTVNRWGSTTYRSASVSTAYLLRALSHAQLPTLWIPRQAPLRGGVDGTP